MKEKLAEAWGIANTLHQNRPHLPYHNWEHIKDVVGAYTLCTPPEEMDDPDEAVQLAVMFHDVVYKVGRQNNEAMSAVVMRSVAEALDIPAKIIDEAEFLIGLTIIPHHLHSTHAIIREVVEDFDDADRIYRQAVRFLSSDLVSLASPWEDFVKHQEDIIKEHIGVDEEITDEHRKKSAEFLVQFLKKPFIYLDVAMSTGLETKARSNIKRWFDEHK